MTKTVISHIAGVAAGLLVGYGVGSIISRATRGRVNPLKNAPWGRDYLIALHTTCFLTIATLVVTESTVAAGGSLRGAWQAFVADWPFKLTLYLGVATAITFRVHRESTAQAPKARESDQIQTGT